MFVYRWLLVVGVRSALSCRCGLLVENVVLRHQFAFPARSSRRRRVQLADRPLLSWLACHWPGWRSAIMVVQPDTVDHWHRNATA